jgi:hypothetical protein
MTNSRRLEERIGEDWGLRYLAGGARPDYWALNDFRRRHKSGMNHVFTLVLELARCRLGPSQRMPRSPRKWRPQEEIRLEIVSGLEKLENCHTGSETCPTGYWLLNL